MKNKFCTLLLIIGPLFAAGQTDSSAIYLQKGVEKEQKQEWEAALRYFQKATELRPGNADAQVALARAATQLKKFDLAATAFQKGLALKKKELGAGAAFSTFTINAGDFEEIFPYAAKAGVLKSDGTTKYILGKSHTITLSDTTTSDSSHAPIPNSAAAIDTVDAEIAYRIGKVFLKKQNYRAAAPFLEQAALLDSIRADRTYECALNFAAIPDPLSAIKYFLLAEKRGYKTDAAYYDNLSKAYKATGQTAAFEALQKKRLSSPN